MRVWLANKLQDRYMRKHGPVLVWECDKHLSCRITWKLYCLLKGGDR